MEQASAAVLIIDADAASRNYLAGMLQKSGYRVLAASSGREGLITAWKDLPQAIVLDPALGDMPGLDLVNRLRRDRRTAGVPLVALGSQESPQETSALLNAGCNEYMVKSTQSLVKLIELLQRLLTVEARPKKAGALIAFLSAKGGMGTSSLCANMAMCLGSKRLDARVAVVDLVLPIGSIADIVGYKDALNVVAVTRLPPEQTGSAYFSEHLPHISGWYLCLLAGSPDPETANQLVSERLEDLLASVQECFDFVFVDLGRGLSRISLPIIKRANQIALILGADVSTLTLTQTVYEYLKYQGLNLQRIYPIMNRAVGLEGLTKGEVEKLLGLQIRVTVPYMGSNFTLANNRHEPVTLKYPDDTIALTLNEAVSDMATAAQTTVHAY